MESSSGTSVAWTGDVLTKRLLHAVLLLSAIPAAAGELPLLDLAALLSEAEASAPALRAAGSRVLAAETLPARAEALPDPMVSFSLQNESLETFTLGDSQMSNATFTWTQEIPFPGKRALRAEAARAESGVATAEAERIRREILAAVKTLYVELHRIHRVRGLVEENRRLVVALRDASRARFETGEAPLEGPLGAGAEIARIDAEIEDLEGQRSEAEAGLTRLLGRSETDRFGPAVAAPAVAPFDPDELLRAAALHATRVGVLRAVERREEARIESLRRDLKPDFSWSAGYAYRGSLDPMVMGMFGVTLPLFRDRKQVQALAGAERSLEAVRHEAKDAALEAESSVREALARAKSAEDQARVFEDAVLPQARAALDAATAAYTTGRVDFATILGYARELLADARRIEDLRARRLAALALLEPSVGRDLVLPAGDPS
jgi:outer membrane protein TolC